MKSISKRRKGISLLITLSVITAMLSLIGVMFSYISVAQKKTKSKSALIEADLLLSDLKAILDKNLGQKPSKEKLQLLYSTPLFIQDKQSNFSLTTTCKPLLNKIPISWLAMDNNPEYIKKYNLAQKLFEQLCEQVDLKDSQRLLQIIKDSLNGFSGTFNNSAFINKKKMTISKNEFFSILNRYRFEMDDKNVYKIEWEEYFSFLPLVKEFDGVDFDFLSPKLIPLLFDIEQEYVNENYSLGEIDQFLATIGEDKNRYKWLFLNGNSPIECIVNFTFKDNSYSFKFNYLNKRIFNFEFKNI